MSKKANGAITWHHDRRQLGALVPWEHNPRLIKKEQAARLLESLETFGQIHAIAVGPDNQIYDGHQRDAVWAASNKYGPGYEIDVRVASRALTDKERAKLVVYLHKGTAGEFDFDALANLPEVDLADLGSKILRGHVTTSTDGGANVRRAIQLTGSSRISDAELARYSREQNPLQR